MALASARQMTGAASSSRAAAGTWQLYPFDKTIFSHVHKERSRYRDPEGASPFVAAAAGAWQLQPVQHDNLLNNNNNNNNAFQLMMS